MNVAARVALGKDMFCVTVLANCANAMRLWGRGIASVQCTVWCPSVENLGAITSSSNLGLHRPEFLRLVNSS